LYPKSKDMKNLNEVKKVLDKNLIEWEEGKESGWSEDTLIFEGGDCKILLYVLNEDGKLKLSYFDLFVKGEYSPIYDCKVKETTTSFRGSKKSVNSMLKDLNLI